MVQCTLYIFMVTRNPLSVVSITESEISTVCVEMTSKQPQLTLPTGAKFPVMGLGTFMGSTEPDEELTQKMVETALEIGYRSLDTARVYNTEAAIGKAIANKIKSGLIKRSDIFVTTKLWRTDARRDDVVPALKKSLERLGLDYVDIFLIHWPIALQGMEECVDKGLTKAIGISNFNSKQILRLLEHCRIKPTHVQIEVNPFLINRKLVDFCHEKGIWVTAFSPLAAITPMYQSVDQTTKRQKLGWPSIYTDETIGRIAKKHGKTPAQVSLRYLMHCGLAVLPKSSNPERQRENFEAIHFELLEEDISEIEKCDRNIRCWDLEPTEHIYYPFKEEL